MVDFSFIKFVFGDFDKAKSGDNPNVATLPYSGFIQQLPNETFTQETNITNGIAFAGGIQVDLIDGCKNVIQNIDNNFYYTSFIDDNGLPQIRFEFGMVGVDYWTKPLHLKVTDLINSNIYYSNSFLITNFRSNLSSRFDYKNKSDLLYKSIRVANCYYNTPQNKLDLKNYTTTFGTQVSYREVPTYLQKFNIDTLDFLVNDRLLNLFTYDIIYLNSQRVTISEYKPTDRKEDTNFLTADFLANNLGQVYNWAFQIYPALAPIIFNPFNNGTYTLLGLPTDFTIQFNKAISGSGTAKLYKGSTLVEVIAFTSTSNILTFTPTFSFVNNTYNIVIDANLVSSGSELWQGITFGNWTFDIAGGQYSNTDYDSNDYLVNSTTTSKIFNNKFNNKFG